MPVRVRRREREEEDDAEANWEEGQAFLNEIEIPERVDEGIGFQVGEQDDWRGPKGRLLRQWSALKE